MNEIDKKINEIEQEYFYLKMQDHWDAEDYKYATELRKTLKELKELKERKKTNE